MMDDSRDDIAGLVTHVRRDRRGRLIAEVRPWLNTIDLADFGGFGSDTPFAASRLDGSAGELRFLEIRDGMFLDPDPEPDASDLRRSLEGSYVAYVGIQKPDTLPLTPFAVSRRPIQLRHITIRLSLDVRFLLDIPDVAARHYYTRLLEMNTIYYELTRQTPATDRDEQRLRTAEIPAGCWLTAHVADRAETDIFSLQMRECAGRSTVCADVFGSVRTIGSLRAGDMLARAIRCEGSQARSFVGTIGRVLNVQP